MRIVRPLLLAGTMGRSVHKLVIAAFAVLAFVASSFAMVSSGMAHGMVSTEHHEVAVCADYDDDVMKHARSQKPCDVSPKDTCDAGPTCCSSACQPLMLVSGFPWFAGVAGLPEPSPSLADAVNPVVLLERPPRRWALS